MEWTNNYIRVFFFPRGSFPDDVLSENPMPSSWGMPLAMFSGDCDMASAFTHQQLVFDTTFCGDWAGQAWSSSATCAALGPTCNSYVENNPSAFEDAYWSVLALKVYRVESGYTEESSSSAYVPATASTYAAAASAVVQSTFAVSTTSSIGYAPVVGSDGSVGYQEAVESAASMAQSPAETGTGSAVVVGADGTVGDEDSLVATPSATQGGGWFTTNADGSVGYSGQGWSHRHARHLTQHKRHSGSRL